MKIYAIRAKNFMSFQELDWVYPERGLYFIGGKVLDSQVSSSNRAGKSVFAAETLSWCLFGKTIRGITGDEVVNHRAAKDCFVEAIVEGNDGHIYTIQRFRKHKDFQNTVRLFREDEDITGADVYKTQEMIDRILGITWLTFSTAIVFGEKAKRFIEATDSEKKEIIDEILMLHQYQEAQQAVKDDLAELKQKTQAIENEKAQATAVLLALQGELAEVQKQHEAMLQQEAAAQTIIEAKRTELRQAELEVAELFKAKHQQEIAKQQITEAISQHYGQMESLKMEKDRAIKQSESAINDLNREAMPVRYRISELESWLKTKNNLPKGTRCKVCGSEITETSIAECAKSYTEELGVLTVKRAEFDKRIKELELSLESMRSEFTAKERNITQFHQQLQQKLDEIHRQMLQTEQKLSFWNNKKSILLKEIEHTEREIQFKRQQLLDRQQHLEKQILQIQQKISEHEAQLATLCEQARYLEFWVEGFGNRGIKNMLLTDVVPQLNAKAGQYCSFLMGDEMRIEFDTEAVLKSGTTKEKFDIRIYSDNAEVKYNSCSAGERRRIDVAVLLALQNLIFDRAAAGCNLVVFDEIFDSLDIVGIEKVVDLLKEEASNRVVFVISHTPEFADFFENIIVVEKHDGISTIKEVS